MHTGKMQRAPGRAAHARLRRLRVLFGKEGLCARVSPAAGTDMELHHSTEPSTHFYSGPGSGMLAGTTRVKHSSKISGYSFVRWEFVEPQVSRTPLVLRASYSRMLPPRESEMRVLRLSPACEHFDTSPLAQVSAADSSPSAGPAHAHTDPWPPPSSREEKPEGTGREEGPHPPGLPWG